MNLCLDFWLAGVSVPLSYEERQRVGITTLQERKERGDLITIYKLVNNIERKDRNNLLLQMEEGERHMREYRKKIKNSGYSSNIKKYSFPY